MENLLIHFEKRNIKSLCLFLVRDTWQVSLESEMAAGKHSYVGKPSRQGLLSCKHLNKTHIKSFNAGRNGK